MLFICRLTALMMYIFWKECLIVFLALSLQGWVFSFFPFSLFFFLLFSSSFLLFVISESDAAHFLDTGRFWRRIVCELSLLASHRKKTVASGNWRAICPYKEGPSLWIKERTEWYDCAHIWIELCWSEIHCGRRISWERHSNWNWELVCI